MNTITKGKLLVVFGCFLALYFIILTFFIVVGIPHDESLSYLMCTVTNIAGTKYYYLFGIGLDFTSYSFIIIYYAMLIGAILCISTGIMKIFPPKEETTKIAILATGILSSIVSYSTSVFSGIRLLSLLEVPNGTMMRPMGLWAFLALTAIAGLFIALPLALVCVFGSMKIQISMKTGFIALAGAGMSILLWVPLFFLIVDLKHFILEK